MNYIYDIVLNYKDLLYEFYDWNLSDNIKHIKKMPLFRVKKEVLYDLKNYEVKFNENFLKQILNKTEFFSNKNIRYLEYAFVICDDDEILAFEIKNNFVKLSRLIVEEELEILDMINKMDIFDISYVKMKKRKIENFKTRREMDLEKYLKKELKKLQDENIDKLKYIYYECFDEQENDRNKIISKLNYELNKNFNLLSEKLYAFFKLVHK